MGPDATNLRLVQSLHPRLLHLFKRWPPQQIAALAPSMTTATPAVPETTTKIRALPRTTSNEPLPVSMVYLTPKPNPFMPWKNPRTGNWHGAHYSLRRQAEMFKLAKEYGVMSLMPRSPKHPDVKEAKRLKRAQRPIGTALGKKIKGKKWERQLGTKLDTRRKAMAGMPEMIKEWKLAGHGRGWKKYPK